MKLRTRKRPDDIPVAVDVITPGKKSTQAKNNLLNPSKGKQKRIRQTNNLDKDDEALMKAFGIIQSKVCLSRVNGSVVSELNNESADVPEKDAEHNSKGRHGKELKRKFNYDKSSSKDGSVVKEETNSNNALFDDDSDIEVIEPKVELIILDEESNISDISPSKKVCATNSRNIPSVNTRTKNQSPSDTELLKQFGLKEMSVNLRNSPVKLNVSKRPGPKCKTMPERTKLASFPLNTTFTPTKCMKKVDEMSEAEIQAMLRKCGMGISVPVPTVTDVNKVSSDGKNSVKRKCSPEPSTSHGHRYLKRSRTARKTTNDSALFDKYKLKDSKVILKNLSRIDISLLRNPNSPFGKSDWLKHKFDSESESDTEWDIPTPPMMEEFIENTNKTESGLSKTSHTSPTRRSPRKPSDAQMLEKFGINDSVVVLENAGKNHSSLVKTCIFPDDVSLSHSRISSQSVNKKCLSDAELLKKFGIPDVKVVISSGENPVQDLKEPLYSNTCGKFAGKISFADFKSALDTACKKILGKSKNSPETENVTTCDNENGNTKHGPTGTIRNTRLRNRYLTEKKKVVKNVVSKLQKISEGNEIGIHISSRGLRESPRKIYEDNIEKESCYSCTESALSHYKTKVNKLKKLSSAKKIRNSHKMSMVTRTKHNCNSRVKQFSRKGVTTRYKFYKNGTMSAQRCKKRSVARVSENLKQKSNDENLRNTISHSSLESEKSNDIPQLIKSLPVVKVKVPVLTEEEILKLTKQFKAKDDHDKMVNDSELIVSDILNEILLNICCSEETLENSDDNILDIHVCDEEDKRNKLLDDLKNNELESLCNETNVLQKSDCSASDDNLLTCESDLNSSIVSGEEVVSDIHNVDFSRPLNSTDSDKEPNGSDHLNQRSDVDVQDNDNSSLVSELSLISESPLFEEINYDKPETTTQKFGNEDPENVKMSDFHDVLHIGESVFFDENEKMNDEVYDAVNCESDSLQAFKSNDQNEGDIMKECVDIETNNKDHSNYENPDRELISGQHILKEKFELIDKDTGSVIGDWYDVMEPKNWELRDVDDEQQYNKSLSNAEFDKIQTTDNDVVLANDLINSDEEAVTKVLMNNDDAIETIDE